MVTASDQHLFLYIDWVLDSTAILTVSWVGGSSIMNRFEQLIHGSYRSREARRLEGALAHDQHSRPLHSSGLSSVKRQIPAVL